jgi:hypothetical protein
MAAELRKTLPRDQQLIVYCLKGGQVSRLVVEATIRKSRTRIKFLEGGILDWDTDLKNPD